MIELTDEQVQALGGSPEAPPRAVNPRTNETFVLLRVEEYERLKADEDELDYSPWTPEELGAAAAEVAEATDWAVIEDDEPETADGGGVVKRGDVVAVRFPHASGVRGKKRPAVVVQADSYAGVVNTVTLVEITGNLALASDPACLLIDVTTAEGQATGLTKTSVVSCLVLATVFARDVQPLGALSPALMQRLDACLKAALGLP